MMRHLFREQLDLQYDAPFIWIGAEFMIWCTIHFREELDLHFLCKTYLEGCRI